MAFASSLFIGRSTRAGHHLILSTAPLRTYPTTHRHALRMNIVRDLFQSIKKQAATATSPGTAMQVPDAHYVLKTPLDADFAAKGYALALFGLGCFWGAERAFWTLDGVYSTSVGYAGGTTENPTYRQVCSGRTGHAEVVRVVYDPKKISYQKLLDVFWDKHDPRQLNRQGNDVGTQYRTGIYYYDEAQKKTAEKTLQHFQGILDGQKGMGKIVTEILPAPTYYFAEDYHQQYLAKNPGGYCGLGGIGCYKPSTEEL
mmetsp:Transcript_17051/g.41861  ORF Transcript_17051/g.41861 Transcript_17051/m.41861 type:complete len:257 (-) Transcript_17051:194-964(-)